MENSSAGNINLEEFMDELNGGIGITMSRFKSLLDSVGIDHKPIEKAINEALSELIILKEDWGFKFIYQNPHDIIAFTHNDVVVNTIYIQDRNITSYLILDNPLDNFKLLEGIYHIYEQIKSNKDCIFDAIEGVLISEYYNKVDDK